MELSLLQAPRFSNVVEGKDRKMFAKNASDREQRTLTPSFPAGASFHGTRDSRNSLRIVVKVPFSKVTMALLHNVRNNYMDLCGKKKTLFLFPTNVK